ncbi:MAG TPA: cytochrome P450 [Pseudonocardiaceae bacterium]|jgi:pentalenene oxygenase|nr:cytochrome P450 [Pseudonocardiaceae bacterium]
MTTTSSAATKTANTVAVAPRLLPLIGNLPQLLRNPLGFLASLPKYGDLVRIGVGPIPAIVVCDPELTRKVLVDDRTFDKGGPYFDLGREVLGDGLGTCAHAKHRWQRRTIQPAFHHSRFPRYAELMATEVIDIAESWHDGEIVDIHKEMAAMATQIAVDTMFAGSVPLSTQSKAREDISTILDGAMRWILTPKLLDQLPVIGRRKYHRAIDRLRGITRHVRAKQDAGEADAGNLLSILVAARDPEHGGGLSDNDITDQVVTFFAAGVVTTAITLTWALFFVAQHPDVERRLLAEAESVLSVDRAPYDQLPLLPFTNAVLIETLRLYPPAWLFTRLTTVDTELGGHQLPKGTTLVCCPYVVHHRDDLFAEPERFDPDRWSAERAPSVTAHAFGAFGTGARKCIGEDFALTEATLGLAHIVSRWHVDLDTSSRARPAVGLTLGPRGIRLRVTRRGPDQQSAPR